VDLYDTLLSPLWWAAVLGCSTALTILSRWVVPRLSRGRRRPAPPSSGRSRRRLRAATLVVALLVLANLAMLGTLTAANLHTPRLAGPVGLAFILCCLVSLTLAVLMFGADTEG
jgi:hypothetical protein